jgi:hypothetical protein
MDKPPDFGVFSSGGCKAGAPGSSSCLNCRSVTYEQETGPEAQEQDGAKESGAEGGQQKNGSIRAEKGLFQEGSFQARFEEEETRCQKTRRQEEARPNTKLALEPWDFWRTASHASPDLAGPAPKPGRREAEGDCSRSGIRAR